MIIKIAKDWKSKDLWHVQDETGKVVRLKIRSKSLPLNVVKAVDVTDPFGRAYFHAEMRDGALVIGHRAVGNPQW